ncbi:uncharacterized protein LOC107882931 isoform X3 [Acyrthosiphon pisum]|uniref:Uncharacterized protein n=1 Tax=Acyrthosiphon pisum TaxID=7029 RepID=A0A8R2D207_ACYPI|nr:uncharacterized protein LOC107882931 isoform X3 [Acyrthosiphon pisum]|eukprot:XP_016657567.1 PREDICTED: uncharacterized protein LOC107882931 isoform X2 [Acyrthosiphon pisum]
MMIRRKRNCLCLPNVQYFQIQDFGDSSNVATTTVNKRKHEEKHDSDDNNEIMVIPVHKRKNEKEQNFKSGSKMASEHKLQKLKYNQVVSQDIKLLRNQLLKKSFLMGVVQNQTVYCF